jgi:NAD(P)-dependent dehydrogenase (short-subunit alcohol dehydrogenase family)
MTRTKKTVPVALITGGAKRIGKAIAIRLANRGYAIALHYHSSKAEASATARRIRQRQGHCELFCCDLSDPAAVCSLIKSVLKTFSRLDILINNASVFKPGPLKDARVSELDRSYAIHLRAPYILMQEFASLQKRGQIINILDTKISQNAVTHVPYLLFKKALADLTRLAAVELAPAFRVNGVCPGPILAPEGKSSDYLKNAARTVPLQKSGSPEDICDAVEMLIDHNYMTGQLLFEDGGAHLL